MSKIKPFINKPSKEIKIDKQEMANIRENGSAIDEVTFIFGKNRIAFLVNERNFIKKMDLLMDKADQYMKVITEKYKIIGEIERIDFKNNKIVMR